MEYQNNPKHLYDHRLHRLFNTVGMTLLLFLLSSNLLQLPLLLLRRASMLTGGRDLDPFSSQLGMLVVYTTAIGLTLVIGLYLFHCEHQFAFPMAPVRHDYLVPAIFAGLGVTMVGNIVATVLAGIMGSLGVYSQTNQPSFSHGLPTLLLTLFGTTVLPAVLEELLFRGILLQPLRRYGDGLAVVVSAVAFALCHPTLPQAINALIVGLCLGVFAVRSGSLALPMLLHFIYNSISCVLTLVALFTLPIQAAVFSWAVVGLLLIFGGIALLILRKRFGTVWRVARWGTLYCDSGLAWRAALTSVPMLAAVTLCTAAILHNLYIL